MAYAESTSVPVERSRAEVEKLLTKYGATDFGYIMRPDACHVMFRAKERNVMFRIALPRPGSVKEGVGFTRSGYSRRKVRVTAEDMRDREVRRRWRALALVIKAKLESVASGIEVFEDAFLAQIVLPGGRTVGEEIRGNIAEAYKHNSNVPLLPAWGGKPSE
jgi:hypothetical protein